MPAQALDQASVCEPLGSLGHKKLAEPGHCSEKDTLAATCVARQDVLNA